MGDKEPGKSRTNPSTTEGLMTRGRLQRLQGLSPPKPSYKAYLDDEVYTPKPKGSSSKSEQNRYGKMMGPWYQQQLWPPSQAVRVSDIPKMMPKHPNFFMPQMHPQMAHQMPPQMAQMAPHMAHLPVPQPGMPIRPGQVGSQHPIQQMSPKMAQMMPMMMQQMRGIPFSPKSQSQSPTMAKSMRPMPMMRPMPNVNSMMYPQMFPRMGPKSPQFSRHALMRSKMAKSSVSPKNMDSFLNENAAKGDKIDLNQLLRDEISKILQQELDRINDLHTDSANYDKKTDTTLLDNSDFTNFTDYFSKIDALPQDNKNYPFKYVDLEGIIDVLIEGFREVLEVMWNETKKYHQYSLDDEYYRLTNQNKPEEQEFDVTKLRRKVKKKSKHELVVVRNFSGLKSLFKKKDEVQKLMASYRNNSRAISGNNFFTFSNFNTANTQSDSDPSKGQPEEDPFLKKAIEYADVASNQKQLLNNVTALDFRAALSGDYLINYLPNVFRLSLMETVSTLHFDLGTPPQLSPKLSKHTPEQDAVLSKVYDTLQSFQSSDTPSSKPTAGMPPFPPFMPNFKPFKPDERLKDMIPTSPVVKRGFGLPPGMAMFPAMPPGARGMPPAMSPNMSPNLRAAMPNMPLSPAKGVPHPAAAKNFNLPPGLLPPQMVMPNLMPPHMSNNQFYNK